MAKSKRKTVAESAKEAANLGGSASVSRDVIPLGRASASPVGLIRTDRMNRPDWDAIGRDLGRLYKAAQWVIGDWLLIGETKWGTTYETAMELTGLDEQTLMNYKYVAKAYPEISLRREKLSWSHHASIAAHPERITLLEEAERERWPVRKLKEEARLLIPHDPQPAKNPVDELFSAVAGRFESAFKLSKSQREKLAKKLEALAEELKRGRK